ncbi:MAG: hypothetical protein R3D44_14775 [Hyphomicrobiaceae bacterium]
MPHRLTISAATFLLGPLVVAGAPGASAESRCYGEWSEAAPIVMREKLKSAIDVQDMAREELGGDVVRIVLCEGDGDFTYRLVLRRSDGQLGTMTVSARRKGKP